MDKHFETHKAKLLLEQDGLYLIDFRREDGSSTYYIRFFIDTNRSSVHIEGDLGECISCWYNKNTLANISNMMSNTDYWIEKFCCSSDKFTYDEDKARRQLEEYYDSEYGTDASDYDYMSKRELVDNIMEGFDTHEGINTRDEFVVKNLTKLLGQEWYECLPIGEEIHPRVYLWAEALDIALKQLNLK